mgnify:FL=1
MVSSVNSSSYNTTLSSYFTNLISNIMSMESQPLDQMEERRDTISLQRAAYVDMQSKIQGLKTALGSLISTNAFYSLNPGRTTSVTNAPTNTTVLSASANSSAVAGTYDIQVTKLAKAQRDVSAVQSSADMALGKSGDIWLGGLGTASFTETSDPDNLVGTELTSVFSGMSELGTGNYTIETRISGEKLQFRVKDADGNAVSILNQSGDATSTWQDAPAAGAAVDTGRGLKFTFTGAAGTTASLSYTAAGTSITVAEEDSLMDIAKKINASVQPDGHGVVASVIGKQLVLTAASTGTNHTLMYTDGVGLGMSNQVAADDAVITVNGITLTRQSNTKLTDVIGGVTLNLAADAVDANGEGRSATLNITNNSTSAQDTVKSFVEAFNNLQTYISAKTAITKVNETYTRGALASESIFKDLRSNLFSIFMQRVGSTNLYRGLSDIGLSIGDDLKVSISDSAALENALTNHESDVNALFDSILGEMDSTLGRFLGTSGYMSQSIRNLDAQITDMGVDITNLTERLTDREASLYQQYGEMQATLNSLSSTYSLFSSIYGSKNSLYT